ncbi:MAG: integrase [Desulfobacteraceae bacterium]|nr:MAG: integrase [Desulfobacteraceae bacterium]
MSTELQPFNPSTPPPVQVGSSTLLESFLSGRSGTTLKAYQGDIADFTSFRGMADPVAALEGLLSGGPGAANAVMLAYKANLMNRGLKSATVNRRLAALRSVVKLARTLGMVTWALEVSGLRHEPYRDTRGTGRDGYKALLAQAERQKPGKRERDLAILHMLYDLALRRGEIASLDLADLDMNKGVLAVKGKGRTEKQLMTLPQPTLNALSAWVEVRGDGSGALFTNFDRAGKGERLTGAAIFYLVRRFGKKAGLVARPHGLRHAAITEALDLTGGDVRKVQKFSRHRDLRTVCLYDDCREDVGRQVAALVAGEN